MLFTRILTAAALLAALLASLLLLDRASFGAVVALVVALGAIEWGRLAGLGRETNFAYAAACTALYAVLVFDAAQLHAAVLWIAAAFWLLAVPAWLARGVSSGARAWLLAAGVLVLIPAGLAMATMQPALLLMALGLTWVADTAAYASGRVFGRRKLAPSISPGKTWEGVAGGLVACLIYAIICAMLNPVFEARVQGAAWVLFLAGAGLLCAASVVGDLFESALKRQAGAKDSGRLLPGHGGVLDRIDSATATLPPALLMMQAMGAA